MGGKRGFLLKDWRLYCFFLCFVSLSLFSASPLFAADEDEDEFTLEEITVTAEKREAVLQKLPMDITVVRPDDMQRQGVHTAYDLSKIMPDVGTESTAGSYIRINIRNVQTEMWNPIHETTVAMHLDGVQLTRINGYDNMFYDLQRLEVLKGPQGTLYGRGSTSGSMNIITQKPILDKWSGNLSVEAGNYSLYRLEGALNVPITEKLAMRFAGRSIERDGYNDAGYSDAHSWGGRVSLTWEPSDIDTITATYDFEGFRDKGAGNSGIYLATYGGITIVPNTYIPNPLPEQLNIEPGATVIRMPWKDRWYMGPNGLDDQWNDNNSQGFMAQWERDLDFAYGVIVWGHRSLQEQKSFVWGSASLSTSYTPNPAQWWASSLVPQPGTDVERVIMNISTPSLFSTPSNSTNFNSIEARLVSKTTIDQGDKFEWVTGAMASNDRVWENDLGPFNMHWIKIRTLSKAWFGQASYSMLPGLNFSAGYRYSWDTKQYLGATWDPLPNAFFPTWGNRNGPDGQPIDGPWESLLDNIEAKWNKGTYKANVNWFLTDTVMTYFQYSKGYKTGNITYRGGVTPPELLDSWELGLKSRFLNNRLQVNGSGYFYDYKNYTQWVTTTECLVEEPDDPFFRYPNPREHYCADMRRSPTDMSGNPQDPNIPDGQSNNFDARSYSTAISPGGAKQYGLSTTLIWLITANDTATFTGNWSKNEYKDYHIGNAILEQYPESDNAYTNQDYAFDRDGEEFGGAPFRFNASYNHTEYIGTDMLFFNVMGFYEGKGIDQILLKNTDLEYTMPGRDAYITMDGSVTYSSSRWMPQGVRWSARLWCNNLFNRHALSYRFYSDFYSGTDGTISRTDYSSFPFVTTSYNVNPMTGTISGGYIQPRTFGITFSVDF